jgi:transcriptional regulator GlxA family with amidase domain
MMSDKLTVGVSINELADACGLSAGALFRGFKQSSGVSPHQWLLNKRVEVAIEFMRDPNVPLCEVALGAGFFDQSHFSRTFTQNMGITPGAWRKASEHKHRRELA